MPSSGAPSTPPSPTRRPGDVTVFAYGSLIWNPIFLCRAAAGHRLRTASLVLPVVAGRRGTPECPGLVLGLDHGEHCRGLAYRIAAEHVDEELFLLWRREMVTAPTCRPGSRPHPGRAHSRHRLRHQSAGRLGAGRMAAPETARCIARASGLNGPNADYLVLTLSGLREAGIEDNALIGDRGELSTHII